MSNVIARFNGSNGHALLYMDKVVIKHNRLIGGTAEKTIFLSQLTGVTIKKTTFTSGMIYFSTGSSEMKEVNKSIKDENALITPLFSDKKAFQFKAQVEEQIGKLQSGKVVASQSSSADEIAKFNELLQKGIITQEEFDSKKKQLLGL